MLTTEPGVTFPKPVLFRSPPPPCSRAFTGSPAAALLSYLAWLPASLPYTGNQTDLLFSGTCLAFFSFLALGQAASSTWISPLFLSSTGCIRTAPQVRARTSLCLASSPPCRPVLIAPPLVTITDHFPADYLVVLIIQL